MPEQLARSLLTAAAVRSRCRAVLDHVANGDSRHFTLRRDRLDAVASQVASLTRERFPTLDIPLHSRWRHFETGGIARWSEICAAGGLDDDPDERARAEIDLVVVGVLLDAGAGPGWRYLDPWSQRRLGRSEGLAVAALAAFRAGLFSAFPDRPLRADASALAGLDPDALARAFSVDRSNPMTGFEGRAALLRRLGRHLGGYEARARPARPGDLFERLRHDAPDGALPAGRILERVLAELSSIWPSGQRLGGQRLGDTWRHRAVRRDDETDGLVPFHKLSQWLSYSLIEPLGRAGLDVTDLDQLTGLAEYRNGGLFVDHGVLELREPGAQHRRYGVGDELVVEWRACTVGLLDELAPMVGRLLHPPAGRLPLVQLLEGGTWNAGRRVAAARRPDGGPPIEVETGGTVF